jgi:dsRNA-specific ribonuclease
MMILKWFYSANGKVLNPESSFYQSRHPVQLLNELRGGVVFNVIGEAGAPPHMTFTMAIEIDGKLYKGEGRNKKDAKRNCAVAALQEIYNIVYPKDGMDTSA